MPFAEVEVISHHVAQAGSHLQKIIEIIKQQREAGTIDPQVNFWGAVLSDAYLSNNDPKTRETCLKHACCLKELIYGGTHKESTDALNKLAYYYIDQNEVNEAINILSLVEKHWKENMGGIPTDWERLLISWR